MNNEEGNSNIIIYIPMIFNALIGIVNRILQICYYCITNSKKQEEGFQTDTVQQTALTFCIMPTAVNIFMITLYTIFHHEEMLTPLVKFKNFLWFVLSCEFLYPIGVHRSFKTKYSYNADNPLITMRLVNAIHFMFVALPQLLIISINSSAVGKFKGIDIASLIFSCFFMVWSVGYYFICIAFDDKYDDLISTCVEKNDKSD